MSTFQARRPVSMLAPLAAALLLAGCATATRQVPVENGILATDARTAELVGAPKVTIATEYERSSFRRVRTRIGVDRDAYVLVVNVAPDGAARIVFPETPKDHGMLRGGQSYTLPLFFGGYPAMNLETATTTTRFVTVGRSALASPLVEGPGYIFVLASRTPFDMQRLEDAGLFDWAEFGYQLHELEPDAVIPAVTALALGHTKHFIAASDVARYAGYDRMAGQRAYAYGGMGSYCPSTLSLFETWSFWNTGTVPLQCRLDDPFRLRRLTPTPRPPGGTTEPDSTVTPPDSGGDGSAPNPLRRPKPRPQDGGLTTARDRAIELDRATREQMLRREKLDERRLRRDAQIGTESGGRLRPRSNPDVDGERRLRSRPSEATQPRSSSGSDHASPGSTSAQGGTSSAGSSSGASSSGGGSARPVSRLPDRDPN